MLPFTDMPAMLEIIMVAQRRSVQSGNYLDEMVQIKKYRISCQNFYIRKINLLPWRKSDTRLANNYLVFLYQAPNAVLKSWGLITKS